MFDGMKKNVKWKFKKFPYGAQAINFLVWVFSDTIDSEAFVGLFLLKLDSIPQEYSIFFYWEGHLLRKSSFAGWKYSYQLFHEYIPSGHLKLGGPSGKTLGRQRCSCVSWRTSTVSNDFGSLARSKTFLIGGRGKSFSKRMTIEAANEAKFSVLLFFCYFF